jgi:hypothetical protein
MARFAMILACACMLCGNWAGSAWAEEAKKPRLQPIDVGTPAEAVAEAKIRKVLEENTKIDFTDQPLQDVVSFLQDTHQIPIRLDTKALEDASIGLETPIDCHLRDISLRSALRLILGPKDLTYLIKDEVLWVTTPDKASNELVIKVYPVSDLTMPARGKVGGEDFAALIDVITTTYAPSTWDEVGGPGSVQFLRKSRSLVISQTAVIHEGILELLTALREARDAQPEAPQATALESIADSLWTLAHPTPARRPGRGPAPAPPENQAGATGGGMF